MPLSRSRDYLSIGEVLESVRDEFPDISISKIRFLESEGLISPERTESGYRKFFDKDVARLRYILGLQRDHFMPLRVIRDRLKNGNGEVLAPPEAPGAVAGSAVKAKAGEGEAAMTGGVQMTRQELAKAAGVAEAQLKGLEDFGLLPERDTDVYDEVDLMIVDTARRLMAFGVEPRHLRMYRQFADRETAFFEQIVTPASRRQDPDAMRDAARSVEELTGLSRKMHDAMLKTRVKELL